MNGELALCLHSFMHNLHVYMFVVNVRVHAQHIRPCTADKYDKNLVMMYLSMNYVLFVLKVLLPNPKVRVMTRKIWATLKKVQTKEKLVKMFGFTRRQWMLCTIYHVE